jgi:transcriptional regulator of acetoin/glycerol metabolism
MLRERCWRIFVSAGMTIHESVVGGAAEAPGLERSHLYRKMRALGIAVREQA